MISSVPQLLVLGASILSPYLIVSPSSLIIRVRCHQLLADIIRVKRPKVVIRYQVDGYDDSWMKQVELPSKEEKFERKEIKVGGNHKTLIL